MTSLVGAALAVREAYGNANPVLLDPMLRAALDELWSADPTDVGTGAVRRSDPATSRRGAAAAVLRAGSQRHRLLSAFLVASDERAWPAFRHTDLTADEAHERTTIPPTACYWKRVSELAAAGFIEPTGATRAGRAGEQQTVYRITELGREALHALWQAGR